jgi:hypothetical protein
MIDWLFPDKLKDLKDFEFADFRSGDVFFGILIAWLFINGFFQEQEKVNLRNDLVAVTDSATAHS